MKRFVLALVGLLLCCVAVQAQEKSVLEQLGNVQVKAVEASKPTKVPYITWGGDLAAFQANGTSLRTVPNSTYGKLGLDLQFVDGNDPYQQTRDYLGGKSPYWRGTTAQAGIFSEALNATADTKPVCILRLTWSLGDHIVGTEDIKMLQDLKGATIILQKGGPHVGLVDDTLRAASLKWDDITVIWTTDITGKNGPADAFRKAVKNNPKKLAVCVITPDMIGLTGGLDSAGSTAEGNVLKSHVVNSTSTMNRSIGDAWYVRADYLKSNPQDVQKFVAGFLKGTEDLVRMRNAYQDGEAKGSFTKSTGPQYKTILTLAQTTFGKDFLPTLEEDAHGLLLDAEFAGLPGQIGFFEDASDLNNFERKSSTALDLALGRGYVKNRAGFDKPRFDYRAIAKLAGIEYKLPSTSGRIAEDLKINPDSDFDNRTIYSFTIKFDENQTTFSPDVYGADFKRALEQASLFGNAVILVKGHADTNLVLAHLVRAGLKKGVIKRTGGPSDRQYFLNGKALDLAATPTLVKLIESGAFDGDTEYNPREKLQAALSLSQSRAESVVAEVQRYATAHSIKVDLSQLKPLGVGIADPVVARPNGPEESLKNMRVEFSIIKVPAESIKADDYDF